MVQVRITTTKVIMINNDFGREIYPNKKIFN